MQIDFHHGATYVVARLGGLTPEQARIVAYCAQYVDDATNHGVVEFNNGARYSRIASAHKNLDYSNFRALEQARVWLPFHFLPGNDNREPGDSPPEQFVLRLITRPNSPPARDMMRLAVQGRSRPWGLHRLGISMHTYADTWAHQGFAGVAHRINDVDDLEPEDASLLDWGQSMAERLQTFFVESALPLGHGAVLSYPDRPYLRWRYRDWAGDLVVRDNTRDFLTAADNMVRWTHRYRLGDADADVPGLTDADGAVFEALLRDTRDPDGGDRHAVWLAAIAEGRFSFGPEQLSYVPSGEGSWKAAALGLIKGGDDETGLEFSADFVRSDWKLFHDALQSHRLNVLHDVLPRYGICAA